ncbi:MAG TPA: hypothetical protein VGJ57_09775 [Nitrospirales bacterium]|jgi:type IV pilus assembly protein PilY1
MKVLLRIASIISLGFLLVPAADLRSQNTSADYSGTPTFLAATVTPNILLLMDNSGSMALRTDCPNDPDCPPFDFNHTYSGLFDALSCYDYVPVNSRFESAGKKPGGVPRVFTKCNNTKWDGNLLNWITYRRIDSVKKSMTGGLCATARNPDGTCPAIGVPARVTVKGEDANMPFGDVQTSYPPTWCNPAPDCQDTGLTRAQADGRVPDAVQGGGAGTKLYFHLRGSAGLNGSFCVDDDTDAPYAGADICDVTGDAPSPLPTPDLDAFNTRPENRRFVVHVAVAGNQLGVIQKVGSKARLGLIEFRSSVDGDGGKVVVPIGGRQVVPVFATSVTTYQSNSAAMIVGVDTTLPQTATPLAETLYTAIRYVAQLPQPYDATKYTYPLAFSGGGFFGPGGVPFNTTGPGGIRGLAGDNEIKYLSDAEAALCVAPYIASACARDPFFFASNNDGALPASVQGPWIMPPSLIQCCQTFIVVFTDGEPTSDLNIPFGLKTFAAKFQNLVAPLSATASALDDVAYFGHTNDLRPEWAGDPACSTIPKGIPTVPWFIWTIFEWGHPICGMQNVTIYSFFAFGSGSNILKQTAKLGGYVEQDAIPNGPDKLSEWARFGRTDVGGSLIPDNYYEAQNADDLQDQLLAVFAAIGSKVASGSAVGMMTTSTTGEGAQYQAYFFPTVANGLNEVKWVGYLQSLWSDAFGNLREDHSAPSCMGPPDFKLIVAHDCIVKIRYDSGLNLVKVDRYITNAAGTAVSSVMTVALSDIQPLWEAGRELAVMGDPGDNCPAHTGGVTCRRILTWIDVNNGGNVGPSVREFNEFTAQGNVGGKSRLEDICPYLDGSLVLDCNSADGGDQAAALAEAKKIINFVRGRQVAGLRDRMLCVLDCATVAPQNFVWKLGDIINSAPTVVGAPAERYDVLYGDIGYSKFFQMYKDRRQVTYVGSNDGMLHAFNSGYFFLGDDPLTGTLLAPMIEQASFNRTPKKLNSTRTALIACGSLPCDAATGDPTYTPTRIGGAAPVLGAELWSFIPQDLLPQLKFLTSPSYDHLYFVDSKPKITDVRIFCGDALSPAKCINGQAAAHPGGWGTILIGGFRYGGSCSNCIVKGKPRTVIADFNYNGTTDDRGNGAAGDNSDTRVFLSSYFVLDITNPEKDPVLLWVFRDKDLGFTTAAPGILRMNPFTDQKTLATSEKWYVVFGTGPTGHDGSSSQTGKLFAMDLVLGPRYSQINDTTTGACSDISPCVTVDVGLSNQSVRVFSTGQAGSSMGDVITTDIDLDFKHDAVYAGTSYCNAVVTSPCSASGPAWKGAMYRLTTNHGDPDTDQWGDSVGHGPTILVNDLTTAPGISPCRALACSMGPITSAAEISSDELHNIWVFFGTGRYITNSDKTNADQQYFVGVVDCIMSGQCSVETVKRQNLIDVSLVVVCDTLLIGCGDASHNVSSEGGAVGTYDKGFDSGAGNQSDAVNQVVAGVRTSDGWFMSLPNARERDLNSPLIFGGTLFFDTFIPTQGVCEASGTGLLYGLYYLTGTAYKNSSLGDGILNGVPIINRSVSLGEGLPSQVAIHVGAKDKLNGTADGKTPNGACKSGTSVVVHMSTKGVSETCIKGQGKLYSEMLAWRDL